MIVLLPAGGERRPISVRPYVTSDAVPNSGAERAVRTAARVRSRVPAMNPVRVAAGRLTAELERLGIPAVLTASDGRIGLVSVWRDLVIWIVPWSGEWCYWWATDRRCDKTQRRVYAYLRVGEPAAAARRISDRFWRARATYPDADLLAASEEPYEVAP